MTAVLPAQIAEAALPQAARAATGGTKQFISFKIGGEEYAINIMAVREIKGWTETTALPNQPGYILGVMNLRGIIVPVYDLRCRFGMGLTEASRSHVVIIVSARERMAGLLVDAVSDILTVESKDICPVPQAECGDSTNFLAGIIPVNNTMVVILSLDELLTQGREDSAPQITEMQQAA